MKKVFLITDDAPLREALTASAEQLDASVETNAEWSGAKDSLFKDRFDAVCIDYNAIKVEGLDAFILLDNILQKEQTPGVLILRKSSPRAKQFINSLDSFRDSIELAGAEPSVDCLAPHLKGLLAEGAAEASEADDEDDAVVVEVHLPTLAEGDLKNVGLARLLYAVGQACSTGILHLNNNGIERRYAISEGQLIEEAGPTFSELKTLGSAFAWKGGEYRFEPKTLADAQSVSVLRFIYQSIDRHMPHRRVMQAMMPHMKAYPTPTNLWSTRRDRLKGLAILDKFGAACDGETPLEDALAALGADATAGFKASLFARQTDLIVIRNAPTPGRVTIQYDAAVEQAQQQRVEEEKKATKAYRATGTGRLDLEAELRDFLDEIEQVTPYEIFDVWEGCGRAPIQSKFYEMVKTHHPDVYGGNVSGDVKRLAQEIFIGVKDAYTELLKVEDKQTCPDPREQDEPDEENGFSRAAAKPGADSQPSPDTDASRASTERLQRRASTGLGDELSFGGERADDIADSARKSRIERLKAKRNATPIGLSREPSTPIVEGKSRKSKLPEGSEKRREKVDEIRRHSSPGSASSKPIAPKAGSADKSSPAKRAFNEGYKAWRENENKELAYEQFSTAYNLEPDNGKYMTFYGYLLFLNEPDKQAEAQKVLEKAIEMKDRQSLPDAHVFMGQMLKAQDRTKKAMAHFKRALELNPKSREAEREVRLYRMRHEEEEPESKGGSFLKNLFKK
jgi:CheY-like chemotaxis protein